jgi:hypothetical protein
MPVATDVRNAWQHVERHLIQVNSFDLRKLASQAKSAVERRLYGETYWDLHRQVDATFGELSLFTPNSRGTRQQLHALTLQAAGQTMPLLAKLAEAAGASQAGRASSDGFCRPGAEREAADRLKLLFERHGSDKSTDHDYHLLYGAILTRIGKVDALLEIGLGTNNEDVVSSMGAQGRPGASLRAFAEFLPSARIYGADFDRRILFQEDRIRTFFVDQTELASFAEIEALETFDLVIDDGLHAPNANLAVLLFALRRLNQGGFLVIEDIPAAAQPLWHVVAGLMPAGWTSEIVQTKSALVFVAQNNG